MIEANELRLGNLLVWNPKLSNPQITLLPMMVEVAVIAQDKIGYTPFQLEQRVEPFEDDLIVKMETIFKPKGEFEPVILTNDILEQSGFILNNGAYQLKGFYPQIFSRGKIWLASLVPGSMEIELRYLHQLQNLYHTLSGEELEIVL
jgi:hypothetical protein